MYKASRPTNPRMSSETPGRRWTAICTFKSLVSFGASLVGAVYGDMINDAKDRICSVPYDRNGLVNTAWDLGMGDSTTIVFWQEIGQDPFYRLHRGHWTGTRFMSICSEINRSRMGSTYSRTILRSGSSEPGYRVKRLCAISALPLRLCREQVLLSGYTQRGQASTVSGSTRTILAIV